MDQGWEKMVRDEVDDLSDRLLAVAMRWFANEGCFASLAVLPGTGTCAEDLVADTVGILLAEGRWHPGSGGPDPFPLAYTIMKKDFLDLLKSRKYTTTEIRDEIPLDSAQIPLKLRAVVERAEVQLRIDSLRRPLANDEKALKVIELRLQGVEKRAEIAAKLRITVQEVTNIQRRLAYKIHHWEQSFGPSGDSDKKV
jgi:hypothetical protein